MERGSCPFEFDLPSSEESVPFRRIRCPLSVPSPTARLPLSLLEHTSSHSSLSSHPFLQIFTFNLHLLQYARSTDIKSSLCLLYFSEGWIWTFMWLYVVIQVRNNCAFCGIFDRHQPCLLIMLFVITKDDDLLKRRVFSQMLIYEVLVMNPEMISLDSVLLLLRHSRIQIHSLISLRYMEKRFWKSARRWLFSFFEERSCWVLFLKFFDMMKLWPSPIKSISSVWYFIFFYWFVLADYSKSDIPVTHQLQVLRVAWSGRIFRRREHSIAF